MSRKLLSQLSMAAIAAVAWAGAPQLTWAQQDPERPGQPPQVEQIPSDQDLPYDDDTARTPQTQSQDPLRADQQDPRQSNLQQRQLDQQRQPAQDDRQPADAARGQQRLQGRDRPAGLGVAIVPDIDGVRVARVYRDSAADLAGIREGDRILEIDGQPIASVNDLLTTVRQSQPGQTVQVAIDRGGQRQTLEVMLQTRSEALQRQWPQRQSERFGGAPSSDDLAAHIDMLEQEIRRLSDEIADLKAMLTGSPEQQWEREPRQSRRSAETADQAGQAVDRFDQEIRAQSPDGSEPAIGPGQVDQRPGQTTP